MIVHEPIKEIKNKEVVLSAQIETDNNIQHFPDRLWYQFPEKYAAYIQERTEPFAPTALLLAMYLGESLTVKGAISPRLAYHLFEYRKIFHAWYPELFRWIDISYKRVELFKDLKMGTGTATAFTGGVDSFYTVWSHLEENQPIPDARVTHGLFVCGLDLHLNDLEGYQAAVQVYDPVFRQLGLELVQAATNAYEFSALRIDWTIFHGVPLIGAALCLGPLFRRFYLPSSMLNYRKLIPYGSTPLIDHLLSTEITEIVNHGSGISRSEKVEKMIAWEVTHQRLRVCANKNDLHGVQNCGACHKCYRMMALLEILDAKSHYKNFSATMSVLSYIRWGLSNQVNPRLAKDLRSRALKAGEVWIALGVQVTMLVGGITNLIIKIIKSVLPPEKLYQLKRAVYASERTINTGDENDHSSA